MSVAKNIDAKTGHLSMFFLYTEQYQLLWHILVGLYMYLYTMINIELKHCS